MRLIEEAPTTKANTAEGIPSSIQPFFEMTATTTEASAIRNGTQDRNPLNTCAERELDRLVNRKAVDGTLM
jgi:hypothetical protein